MTTTTPTTPPAAAARLTTLLLVIALGAATLIGQRPNVVLLMADDLGYGDLCVQGHPHLHTPHLDRLAQDGVRFRRFHAAAPVCSPTRASCLTGRHPYRADIPHANRGHLRADEVTLQALLQDAGYRTGHFGKWHLGTLTKTVRDSNRGGPGGAAHFAPPWRRGFDVCFSTEAKVPTFDPMRHPTTGEPYGTRYWDQAGAVVTDDLAGDDSRVIMDRAIPFVRACAAAEQPFLCVVWFHAPHLPCVASPADRARYAAFDEATQHYYGCITALDRQVGRLRRALAELDLADDTIVWFCSDNGPEGRAGKAPGSAGGLRGRKRSLYEGGTRVPGLLAWPRRLPAGAVTDTLACTSDFLPTIAGWLDLALPAERELDGVDLGPALAAAGRNSALPRNRPIGFESVRMATWTGDRYKLVAHLAKGGGEQPRPERYELFDLREDPAETTDLAGDDPKNVSRLAADLQRWRTAIRQRP
ncbi:MAG: sulfatase-like hydrolase/transferase [Planctomycetes bacterium]|nr:sulfatase-like hydrolase/transferase [Planctomycetota bacterium]